jgi:hypothetical protein
MNEPICDLNVQEDTNDLRHNTDEGHLQETPIPEYKSEPWDCVDRLQGPKPNIWGTPVTIGDVTKTLRQWIKLSGIGNQTVCQRLERGVLPLQALITPNRAGAYLRLTYPRFPWCEKASSGDSVILTFHHTDQWEFGIEALNRSIFGDDGFRRTKDILAEFKVSDTEELVRLQTVAADSLRRWNEHGQPEEIKMSVTQNTLALLTEVFLRRQGQYVVSEPVREGFKIVMPDEPIVAAPVASVIYGSGDEASLTERLQNPAPTEACDEGQNMQGGPILVPMLEV